MKNTWVLSIKTSLPEVCKNRGDLQRGIRGRYERYVPRSY